MDTDTQLIAPSDELQLSKATSLWGLATRIGFRFAFVYFSVYCLLTQIAGGLLSIPNVDIPDLQSLPPIRPFIEWIGAHIFRLNDPLVSSGSGSGDKVFDWVILATMLVFAALVTAVWSVLDRRRQSYPALHKWFCLVMRFALAGQMLSYGFVKLFPLQMSFPSLSGLLEPYGYFSPMGVLWRSVGASPTYEMLCGSAEVLAGLLLIVPRTAIIGALLSAGICTQIFILNMTYDVPVKLLSFHLIILSLFLLAPEMTRIVDFALRNRAVGPSTQRSLFRTVRANRIALAVQLIFGLWLVGSNIYGAMDSWKEYGGGAPKSPLYGIWKVNVLAINGQIRSPLVNDYGRWRRVIFDYPTRMSYQRMDDTMGGYEAKIDLKTNRIALTMDDGQKWKGTLHFERPAPGQLLLDGDLGGQKMKMQLELVDRNSFRLVSRGFHWVQDYPFNR